MDYDDGSSFDYEAWVAYGRMQGLSHGAQAKLFLETPTLRDAEGGGIGWMQDHPHTQLNDALRQRAAGDHSSALQDKISHLSATYNSVPTVLEMLHAKVRKSRREEERKEREEERAAGVEATPGKLIFMPHPKVREFCRPNGSYDVEEWMLDTSAEEHFFCEEEMLMKNAAEYDFRNYGDYECEWQDRAPGELWANICDPSFHLFHQSAVCSVSTEAGIFLSEAGDFLSEPVPAVIILPELAAMGGVGLAAWPADPRAGLVAISVAARELAATRFQAWSRGVLEREHQARAKAGRHVALRQTSEFAVFAVAPTVTRRQVWHAATRLQALARGVGARSSAHGVERAEPAAEAEASDYQIKKRRHEIRFATESLADDRKVAARVNKTSAYLLFTAHVQAFGLLWNPTVWSSETPPWMSAASFLSSWASNPLVVLPSFDLGILLMVAARVTAPTRRIMARTFAVVARLQDAKAEATDDTALAALANSFCQLGARAGRGCHMCGFDGPGHRIDFCAVCDLRFQCKMTMQRPGMVFMRLLRIMASRHLRLMRRAFVRCMHMLATKKRIPVASLPGRIRFESEAEPVPEVRLYSYNCENNSGSVWQELTSRHVQERPGTDTAHGSHAVEAPAWTVRRALRLGVLTLATQYRWDFSTRRLVVVTRKEKRRQRERKRRTRRRKKGRGHQKGSGGGAPRVS